MKKMQRIFKLLLVLAGAATVLALLSFVSSVRTKALCEGLIIEFKGEWQGFVTEDDVRRELEHTNIALLGNRLDAIPTGELEESILKLPHVRRVAVYKTIDRNLVVEVTERTPIVRLIDRYGVGAYIDSQGCLMPIRPGAVPRIPVVTGAFRLSAQEVYQCMPIADVADSSYLNDIYTYTRCIHQDPFLLAQFQHTEVMPNGDLVVYPQVGNHTITIGGVEYLDERIEKLLEFYAQGLKAANWNKYADINLKFKDQIVCTKK